MLIPGVLSNKRKHSKKPSSEEFILPSHEIRTFDGPDGSVHEKCSARTGERNEVKSWIEMRFGRKIYYLPSESCWKRDEFDRNGKLSLKICVNLKQDLPSKSRFRPSWTLTFFSKGSIRRAYYADGSLAELTGSRRSYSFYLNGGLDAYQAGKQHLKYHSTGVIAEKLSGKKYALINNLYNQFGEDIYKEGRFRNGKAQSRYENGRVFEEWTYVDGICEQYRKYDSAGRFLELMNPGRMEVSWERRRDGTLNRLTCSISDELLLTRINRADVKNPSVAFPMHAVLIRTFYRNGKVCTKSKKIDFKAEGRKVFYDRSGKESTLAYYYDGMEFPARYFDSPETIDINLIIKERNVTKRSAYLRLMGYDLFLSRLKHYRTLDTEGDYALISIDLDGENEPICLLKVKCASTGVFYVLRVPPEMVSCREAVAWTFDLTSEEYILNEEA